MKKIILVSLCLAIVSGIAVWWFVLRKDSNVQHSVSTSATIQSDNQSEHPNKDIGDREDPIIKNIEYPIILSVEELSSEKVVVNKKHKLPDGYVPELVMVDNQWLRASAADAYRALADAARSAGFTPTLISAYRSYQTQEKVYQQYVSQSGQSQADMFSARPGHSEHQTGLALDIDDGGGCALELCFAERPLGRWLKENAVNYGFIIRYPEGKETITGYQYEPWHLRYVGTEVAQKIASSGKTMEEYFNVVGGGY